MGVWVFLAAVFAASLSYADITGRVQVVDGDTLRVGGQVVRLHGIDAPENDQTCRRDGADWACGAWVTQQVRERYEGTRVRCAVVTQDRYGRAVATCTRRGRDIGQALVQDGLAFAYRRYSMAYDLDEKRAAVTERGLHASQVQSPAAFRKQGAAAVETGPNGCNIKGNISGNGRIYHVPGQENYGRTRINTAKGERWFCSRADAEAAGWRAARR